MQWESFDSSHAKVLSVNVPNANQVDLKVFADKPGILVANNFWHKWWKVRLNGKKGGIYRVNYNFQAVMVPPGNSAVHFYCEAESVKLGLYLSIIGSITVIGLLVLSLRKDTSRR